MSAFSAERLTEEVADADMILRSALLRYNDRIETFEGSPGIRLDPSNNVVLQMDDLGVFLVRTLAAVENRLTVVDVPIGHCGLATGRPVVYPELIPSTETSLIAPRLDLAQKAWEFAGQQSGPGEVMHRIVYDHPVVRALSKAQEAALRQDDLGARLVHRASRGELGIDECTTLQLRMGMSALRSDDKDDYILIPNTKVAIECLGTIAYDKATRPVLFRSVIAYLRNDNNGYEHFVPQPDIIDPGEFRRLEPLVRDMLTVQSEHPAYDPTTGGMRRPGHA